MRDYAELDAALQMDIGPVDDMLTSDMSIYTARLLWLRRSFWKKFQDEKAADADSKCLSKFVASNDRCKGFRLLASSFQEEMVVNEVKQLLDDCFHCGPDYRYSFSDWLEGCTCGPGASIAAKSYNFYTKLFDSTLSSTSVRLYDLYVDAIRNQPSWVSAEKARYQLLGNQIVVGNRLSFAPKTREISRSICTEPILNLFVQKGIGHVLEQVLMRKFGINLSHQPELNRQLAQSGSVDGSYCTIDLSSASDSVSMGLVQEILPPEVFRRLALARSPVTIFPDGSRVPMHMVSSMGNAFTFPLETLVFSSLVVACYRVLGIKPTRGREGPENWAVFGDDIIVRKDAYHFVVRCLQLFGFEVNDEKSFASGHFRESCGGDYYRGHDIRGVYCKSLRGSPNIYSILNRLTRWSAKYGILLPKTVSLLLGWAKYRPIPFDAGDAEGVKCAVPPRYLKRSKTVHGGVIYSYLCKVPKHIEVPVDGELLWLAHDRDRPSSKTVFNYNPDGLIITILGGFLRDEHVGAERRQLIGIRSDVDVLKVRKRVTSSWGSTFAAGMNSLRGDWEIISDLYALSGK